MSRQSKLITQMDIFITRATCIRMLLIHLKARIFSHRVVWKSCHQMDEKSTSVGVGLHLLIILRWSSDRNKVLSLLLTFQFTNWICITLRPNRFKIRTCLNGRYRVLESGVLVSCTLELVIVILPTCSFPFFLQPHPSASFWIKYSGAVAHLKFTLPRE